MKPPYEITNVILRLLTSISEKIGEVSANHLHKPSPELRKRNKVKTIKASLEIEGNTLSESQITAILDNKRVVGPKKDIIEVVNAIEVYNSLHKFNPKSLASFLRAHKVLMKDLIDSPGRLRTKAVGIFKGDKVSHIAPPAENLDHLMRQLFDYYNKSEDLILIKSCVMHYEIEFIHPFMDGNGRMGRLWQTLILMKTYPLFEYLPFETIIKDRQDEYYSVLEYSDKEGKSTKFIEFILAAIDEALSDLLRIQNRLTSSEDRMDYFISVFGDEVFTRKDYMTVFKDISTSTASRDLKYGVENKLISRQGMKRLTTYQIIKDDRN
ncbi:MAG: Fic family protein [Bacteroidota bacterium]